MKEIIDALFAWNRKRKAGGMSFCDAFRFSLSLFHEIATRGLSTVQAELDNTRKQTDFWYDESKRLREEVEKARGAYAKENSWANMRALIHAEHMFLIAARRLEKEAEPIMKHLR